MERHRAASPLASPRQSAEIRLPKQEAKHDSKAPSGGVTDLCIPPNPTIAGTARATEKRPNDACVLDAASLEEPTASSCNTLQTPIRSIEHEPEDAPGIKQTEPQRTALSKSQRLWNAAYDSLEEDKDTTELVTSYVKTLTTVLGIRPDIVSGADASAAMKDPTVRQTFMKKLVEEGQAKISTPSKATKGVGDVAQFILSAKKLVDAAIQNLPQAALPWAGVCIGMQILLNPAKATKSNITGIVHVVSRMEWYCALTEHLLNGDCVNESLETILPQLEAKVLALYKALLLYQMKSVCFYYRHQGLVFLRNLVSWDDWDNDLKTVEDAEATLQKDSHEYNSNEARSALAQLVKRAESMEESLGNINQTLREFLTFQKELKLDELDRKCRWDLRVVDPRDDMKKIENNKDTLLPEAYEWVLGTEQYTRFTQWDDPLDHSSCQLLWIKGHAGTGKTMLLMGIIRSFEKQQDFCAPGISCFFCQGTDVTLNSATAALRSLVWMLVVEQPHLISHLRKKYIDSGAALFQDQNAFFPLSEALLGMLDDPELSPILFVVDALDECDRAKPGLDELLDLISASIRRSDKVKWLLSSRPEIDVLSKLQNLTGDARDISENLVELDAQRLAGPVDAYIDHKLTLLRGKRGYDASILAEISNEVRQRAMNTFLWVSLAFEHIEKVIGEYAIQYLKAMPPGLLKLYDHMMTRIENVEETNPEDCNKVLVCAVLAFRPITLSELAALSGMSHNMTMAAIELCGSFLATREDTVYLIHQSAKDYLSNNFNRIQSSGIAQGHVDIGRRSIDAMVKVLKQNMYDLDNGFKPENMEPPQPDPLASIRYSCVFWADHFVAGAGENPEGKRALADDGNVCEFLKKRLLYWLECLSIMEKLPEGLHSIRKLLHIAERSSELARFLKDVETFIQAHGSIIARAPLQAYASALVFSPTTSEVRETQWEHRLPFIQRMRGVKTHWGTHRQTLEGHRDTVKSVAASPDGKLVASASVDRTIRLWDLVMGSHIKTFEGHSDGVMSVSFSPDGKTLASASDDKTVRLWDITTGNCQILNGHGNYVRSVAFSPDGATLASASSDETIRLWDLSTGDYQILKHRDGVRSVAFSPDGTTLASASRDDTIRLWDLSTGSHQTFKGHTYYINSVAFYLDGKALASASSDRTIRLWDITTGSHQTLEGHTSSVNCVALSPDGKTLASASDDNTIRLWDIATGRCQRLERIERYSSKIESIVFLPDAKTLISSSRDNTIRLWDISTEGYQETSEKHRYLVRSVVFSPNGQTLASVSDDGTIRLWHTDKGSCLQILNSGHSELIISVAFSPDGNTLASASADTIRLWHKDEESRLKIFVGHNRRVNSVAFSPNSNTLASASDDKTIRLWDMVTGSLIHKFVGHDRDVDSASFSPDGKTIVSASEDGSIRFWDTATGSHLQTLGPYWVWSVAFSSNGRYLTTNYGSLPLAPLSVLFGQQCSSSPSSDHVLYVDEEWITIDGKKSLWLPADYRATTAAVYGNKMALGHASGRVTFLEVNFP